MKINYDPNQFQSKNPSAGFSTHLDYINKIAAEKFGDIDAFNKKYAHAKANFSHHAWKDLKNDVTRLEAINQERQQNIDKLLAYKNSKLNYITLKIKEYFQKLPQTTQTQYEKDLETSLIKEMRRKELGSFTCDVNYNGKTYTLDYNIGSNLFRISFPESTHDCKFVINKNQKVKIIRGKPNNDPFVKALIGNLQNPLNTSSFSSLSASKRLERLKKFQQYDCHKKHFLTCEQVQGAIKASGGSLDLADELKLNPPALNPITFQATPTPSGSYWQELNKIEQAATQEIQQVVDIKKFNTNYKKSFKALLYIKPQMDRIQEVETKRQERLKNLNDQYSNNLWKNVAHFVQRAVHRLHNWLFTSNFSSLKCQTTKDFETNLLRLSTASLEKSKKGRFKVDILNKGKNYTVTFSIGAAKKKFGWGNHFTILDHSTGIKAEFALYKFRENGEIKVGKPFWYTNGKPSDTSLVEALRTKLQNLPEDSQPEVLSIHERKSSIQWLEIMSKGEQYRERFFTIGKTLRALEELDETPSISLNQTDPEIELNQESDQIKFNGEGSHVGFKPADSSHIGFKPANDSQIRFKNSSAQ